MGLTTSLYTSLSALSANSEAISVAGNNIANVNTTGFKSSQLRFETQISQTFSEGNRPSPDLGGTNPLQVGLGVRLGATQRNFANGALQPTGINTDLAVEGNGFFVVRFADGDKYTRAGTFQLDSDFDLVNPDGGKVQGFGVDPDFNVVEGTVTDINIPLGSLTIAEATTQVRLAGNLNSDGDSATMGSINTSDPLTDSSSALPATAASLLDDLEDATATDLFSVGDIITISGAQKGGATLPDHTFEVGAVNTTGSDANGTTLAELGAFLEDVLGIDTTVGGGVSVSVTGELLIESNSGFDNGIELEPSDIIVNAGVAPTTPFDFTQTQDADGESVRTTFVAFDSLGAPMTIDMTITLEAKTAAGTTWRYYAQSEDDSDLDRVLGNGVLSFDTNGQLASVTDGSFTIDRLGTGAASPQTITSIFDDEQGPVSALADTASQLSAISQDGSAIGTLVDFSIGADGAINGIFSNSELRSLGRIVLASFANPNGLVEEGGNLYNVTPNSGLAALVSPGSGGSGRIVGGALELSNVELSQEFINLISASTGFSASSRVLTTSDQLIQELLNSVR